MTKPRKPRPPYPHKVVPSSPVANRATARMPGEVQAWLAEHRAKYRAKINKETGSNQWEFLNGRPSFVQNGN